MRYGLLKQRELIHWPLDIGPWTRGGCWLSKKKKEKVAEETRGTVEIVLVART